MQGPVEIRLYKTSNGKCPYRDWENKLSNRVAVKVDQYLARLRTGNFGSSKSIGGGLFEIRIHDGPGYRIYYGKDGSRLIILLCAGDKSSQKRDIKRAKESWKEYLANHKRK